MGSVAPKDYRTHHALLYFQHLNQESALAWWNCSSGASSSVTKEEGGCGKSVGHVWNRGFSWAPLEVNFGRETNV